MIHKNEYIGKVYFFLSSMVSSKSSITLKSNFFVSYVMTNIDYFI